MKKIIIFTLVACFGLTVALPTFAIDRATQPVIAERFTNEITATWPAVSGAVKYRVKLYTLKGKFKAANTVINNGATIKKPLTRNGNYKMKVRAVDAQGVRGAWSPYKKFTTKEKRFYHNKKYGFSLDFSKPWEDYRVKQTSTWGGGVEGGNGEIEFKLYSGTTGEWYTMFTMWLVDYGDYSQCPDCYLGELRGYNSDHAYLYVAADDIPYDLGARAQEMDGIIYTFEFDLY